MMIKRYIWMLLAASIFLFSNISSLNAAPDPLELKGTIPIKSRHGEVQGNYLYLLRLEGLAIVDISNPSSPNIVGSVDFPTSNNGINVFGGMDVDGDMVAAYGAGDIVLIDVTDKTQPVIIGQVDASSRLSVVALDYPIVYFEGYFAPDTGMSGGGLQAFDISDPENPVFRSGVPLPGINYCPPRCTPFYPYIGVRSFEFDQGYLYANFAVTPNGLIRKIDIRNPSDIQYVETTGFAGGSNAFEIQDGIMYRTAGFSGISSTYTIFTHPIIYVVDVATNDFSPIRVYEDCTLLADFECPTTAESARLKDLEVLNSVGYILTPNALRLYDLSISDVGPSPFEDPITDPDDSRILATYPEYSGEAIISDSEHLYILGDDVKIVRYVAEDTDPTDLSLDVSQTASRTTLPPSGAHVAFDVMTTNTSPASQWMYPIQVDRYSADTVGEIAPNPQSWTTNCWWWLPRLWLTGSWTCNYSTVASTGPVGDSYSSNVQVEASADNGDSFNEFATTTIPYAEGPGVGSVEYWKANPTLVTETLAQYIDADGDGTLETYGYMIGDTNLNGKCDHYEVWWMVRCLAISADTANQLLHESDETDNRFTMGRALVTTWLNIRSNNDYLCAQADTATNLALIWLHSNAPNGNPYLGGDPVTGADWDAVSWNADWLNWYSETGGEGCAIDIDTGTRDGRSVSDFEPPTPASLDITPATLAAVNSALSQDTALRNVATDLYTETMALILRRETVSTDYLNRLESTFNDLVAAVDTAAANELNTLWAQIDPYQYADQSARSSWDRVHVAGVPTAVSLASHTIVPTSMLLLAAVFFVLISLTVWVKRR